MPQTANQEWDKMCERVWCTVWKDMVSAAMFEVSPSGVRTVLDLDRDAWAMVK